VALGGEVVDLGRLGFLNQPNEIRCIGQIAEMEKKFHAGSVRIGVEMIHAAGIERRRAPLHAVNGIALAEKKLGKVRPVLSGGGSDQGNFASHRAPFKRPVAAPQARDGITARGPFG
jgi:hypothetical protein